jgi:hypothetical protein
VPAARCADDGIHTDVVTFPTDGTQPVGPPWSTPPVVARTLPPVWVPVVNTVIAQADLGGRLGTIGGYGIEFGLQMLDLDSFGLPVTQGVASLDKPVMMPRLSNTDPTVPVGNPNDIAAHVPMVDNQDNYIWLGLGGVLSPVLGSTTPPTGVVGYVGLAHMAAGVLTRDGSGVLYRIPGGLWQRKTAIRGCRATRRRLPSRLSTTLSATTAGGSGMERRTFSRRRLRFR